MLRRLLQSLICLAFLPAVSHAWIYKPVLNVQTGRPDLITPLSASTIQGGTNVTVSTNSDGSVTISATGGGSGPNGSINNANQNAVGYYSVAGSSNVISGSNNFTWNGTTVSAPVGSITGAGVSGTVPAFSVIGGTLTVYANGNIGINNPNPSNIVDIKRSVDGTGGLNLQMTNGASTGRVGFNATNDAGQTASFDMLGSAYTVTPNNASFGSTTGMVFYTDAATSSGGTHTMGLTTGGYNNNPTLTITAGNPGTIQAANITSLPVQADASHNLIGQLLSPTTSMTTPVLTTSSATATYLQLSSATANYAPISGSTNYIQNNPGSVQAATETITGSINTNANLGYELRGNSFLTDNGDTTSVFVGTAGNSTVTGSQLVCVGDNACHAFTSGANTTIIGYNAGAALTSGASLNDTFVGSNSGNAATTSNRNVCVGSNSCTTLSTITGGNDVGIGDQALPNASTAADIICIGQDCFDQVQTASHDVGLGGTAGGDLTTGSQDICIGGNNPSGFGQACSGIKTGSGDTVVGVGANVGSSGGNSASDTNDTLVGFNAQISGGTNELDNATCIGANCSVTSSNTMQLGGTGTNAEEVVGSTFSFSSGTVTNLNLTTLQGVTPGLIAGTNIASITGSWPNQTINATTQGGGGNSTLAISSGSATNSVIISSPTSNVVFDSNTFTGSLQGTTTSFIKFSTPSLTGFYLPLKPTTAQTVTCPVGTTNCVTIATSGSGQTHNFTVTGTGGTTLFDADQVGSGHVTIGAPNTSITGSGGLAVNYVITAGSGVFTNPLNSNTTAMNIINNDTTGQEDALVVQNAGIQNAIQVINTGQVSKSFINGGAVNLVNGIDPTNPTGHGALLVLYSSDTAPADNMVNIRQDAVAFSSNVVYISGISSAPLVSINMSGFEPDGAKGGALNVTSSNPNYSAVSISGGEGAPDGFGTLKISHSSSTVWGAGFNDANASALSIDLLGTGTAAQGIFVKSSASSGTTGKLMNIRNPNTERFVIRQGGDVNLSPSTITATYDLFMSTTPGLTQDNVTIAISTNAEIVVNGSTGTSGQFLSSQGPGLPVRWATATGGGGASSLAVNQNGVQITSPTVALNALAPPFIVTSVGGGTTAQWTLDGTSVTLRGQAWSNTIDASTASIYTLANTKLGISSITATSPIQFSAGGVISATPIGLSSQTVGILPSAQMVSTTAFITSSQTFSGSNIFVSSTTMTPNPANPYVLWIATASPGSLGITTYVYVSTGGTNAQAIMSVNNSTQSTVPVMIMSGQEEMILNDYGLQNAMQINEKGTVSTSFTTGGAFNIFMDTITHGPGMGSGMVIYSPDSAPIDNLVNLRTDNPTFNQNMLFISGQGSSHLLSINDTSTSGNSSAANIVSSNPNLSALQVSGQEVGFGTIKATHTGTGTDGNSAVFSAQISGAGTAAQGIFVTAPTGTTGPLMQLKNDNVVHTEDVFDTNGSLGVSVSTQAAIYEMVLSTTINAPGMPSQDAQSIAISTNGEIVVAGSTGTSGQALTSQGPGLPVKWSTISGGPGGSGITSPSTFTWVSTQPWGIQLSTLNVIGSNLGVNVVQVSTNNTASYALSISSVGYITFEPMSTSTQAFVIASTQGIPMISVDNTAVANTDFVLKIASGDASIIAGIQNSSHFVSSGATPSVSSCGTNPSVVGTDMAGVVTVGSGVTTSCTLSFATAYAQSPVCVISDNSTAITGDISSVATTAVTFGFSASLGGGQVWYICIGNKG